MAAFNERHATTSRKYAPQEGIMMPDLLETLQCFWLHSSVFSSKKQPKNLNFQRFCTSKKRSWLLSMKRALTSGKYVAEQRTVMSN